MIGRSAYFTETPLWKHTLVDQLDGMYDKETHELKSDPKEAEKDNASGDDKGQIADNEEETE